MIYTASETQAQLIHDIETLHLCNRPFHADLTYSTGGFWQDSKPPRVRMDILPAAPPSARYAAQTLQGDIRALPFGDSTLESAVVDLPFVHAPGKDSIMGRRFSGYPSQKALDELHAAAAAELYRVMMPGGVLAWKCQDIVESGKQVWNHIRIFNHCERFTTLDLFILLKRGQIAGHNHGTQQHARRNHSYFWVFRKPQ